MSFLVLFFPVSSRLGNIEIKGEGARGIRAVYTLPDVFELRIYKISGVISIKSSPQTRPITDDWSLYGCDGDGN